MLPVSGRFDLVTICRGREEYAYNQERQVVKNRWGWFRIARKNVEPKKALEYESACLQSVRNQGQCAQPHADRIKDGIRNRRSQADHRTLARAHGGNIFAIKQHSLERRNVAESWHAISRQSAVENLSIFKLDGFEKCTTQSLHIRPFDLIAQVVGIHDRTALEGGNHANDFYVTRFTIDV